MKKRLFTTLVVLTGMLLMSASIVWAAPAPVAKTGQTFSLTTGDDGYYQVGVASPAPRFIDRGDGTVLDKLTGLMWAKDANLAGAMNWEDAINFANGLELGVACGITLSDWRLPNRNELLSLININFNPTYIGPPVHPFIDVGGMYHSSTHVPFNPTGSYAVDLFPVLLTGISKTEELNVWPVRGAN
jgi:hypothetical protein